MPAILKTATLGCKVNQYETEYVREGLLGIGYRDASAGEAADLCVVNTCTVTKEGDAKSRQLIRRLARENPEARIVVMGCYATRAPQEVASLPGVAEVVKDKRELPDLLGRFGVIDIPTGISYFGNRHRAYVKAQDGCMLRCSYCIIPKVRPKLTSRPVDHILEEIRRLVDNGYREIVLTGVHLGHFGVDWNWHKPKSEWTRLSDLLGKIVQIQGDFRVRLSSIEATEVTRELIDLMAEQPIKICPHLHICLQSGSDPILRRMRRRWGTRRFLDRCQLVSDRLDNPAFTTDVLVGFPGETDEDFPKRLAAWLARSAFGRFHIFPFSAGQITAAEMPDPLPKSVVAERSRTLSEIEKDLRSQYFQSLQNRRLRVLIESTSTRQTDRFVGTICRYAPVEIPQHQAVCGEIVEVLAGRVENGRIQAAEDGSHRLV